MPEHSPRRRRRPVPLAVVQPVLNYVARRHRRAAELASMMQLRCCACGAALAAHRRNGKWIGCTGQAGAR